MQSVTVRKSEFITKVTQNRDNHRTVFEKALEGYRLRMIEELERRIQDVRRRRAIDQYLSLPEPEDHTSDYNRVLAMAEMSIEDTITLSAKDFAMFVMDEWGWRETFDSQTAYYLAP